MRKGTLLLKYYSSQVCVVVTELRTVLLPVRRKMLRLVGQA